MVESTFFVFACVVGTSLLASVLWRFLRTTAHEATVLSTTLSLLGFILVSSPLWGSIVVKGPQWEISLLRNTVKSQAESNAQILSSLSRDLPPEKARLLVRKEEELSELQAELSDETADTQQLVESSRKISQILELTTRILATAQ